LHGAEQQEKVGMMVQEMAQSLGIQIIMVSGESALSEYADRTFHVKQSNGMSAVEE